MKDEEKTPYATLDEKEIREKILNGEIRREDLPIESRDLYAEELKKARRY